MPRSKQMGSLSIRSFSHTCKHNFVMLSTNLRKNETRNYHGCMCSKFGCDRCINQVPKENISIFWSTSYVGIRVCEATICFVRLLTIQKSNLCQIRRISQKEMLPRWILDSRPCICDLCTLVEAHQLFCSRNVKQEIRRYESHTKIEEGNMIPIQKS